MTEIDEIARSTAPLTVDEIVRDLSALGVPAGKPLIAHVSLSALGWVAGGAQAVIEALFRSLGGDGTLVMASQSTQLSEPAYWSDPPVPASWISSIRAATPAYDPDLTPARGMGAVVQCLLQSSRTHRSPHPLYSFCAQGKQAEAIVARHPLSSSFGDESPLGRLYELDASVLLLGVGQERNTSLHLAESRANWPGKKTYTSSAPVNVDGERQWVLFKDQIVDPADFPVLGTAFSRIGKLATGHVGAAPSQLMKMREIVDFAVGWLATNRQ